MNEDSFRKLAEEGQRPRRDGLSLFRHGPAEDGPRRPVTPNLPVPILRVSPPSPVRVWESLAEVSLDPAWLAGNGLFAKPATDPATAAFDILRTRLLQAFHDNGWRRVAVTSPTHGCGKSLVAANLALSLSRRPGSRTVLMDFELRRPGLATLLGLRETEPLRDFLTGAQPMESHFLRVGRTLALALNGQPVADASELLQAPDTVGALDAMMEHLDPEVVVFDLPPVLVSDDVLAILPQVDAVLLVIDGTRTTADEVKACERLFEGRVPLLGVVLNRAQDLGLSRYRYGRGRR